MAKKLKEKLVKAIIVLFTLKSLKEICRAAHYQQLCYGDVTMADTLAMNKILTVLTKGESRVIV